MRRFLLPLAKQRTIGARWQSTTKVVAPSTSPQSVPPVAAAEPKKKTDFSSTLSLMLASFLLGAGLAYALPLSEVAKLTALERLPEPGTPEEEVFKSQLEKKLTELELYKRLSSDPDYVSRRAWSYLDSNTINPTLTSGTLSVPGGFAIRPVIFVNEKKKEVIAIVHAGQKLCGYPFLIHGGILASILDEVLKRGSSFKFGIDPLNGYTPKEIKTNLIELQYKFPTLANNFIVVKTSLNEKGQVVGDVETLKGRLLVKGLGEFSRSSIQVDTRKKWFGIF